MQRASLSFHFQKLICSQSNKKFQPKIFHQAKLIKRAVGLNDLAGPPAAGCVTKGQGAAGLVRVCDEGRLNRLLFAVLFLKKYERKNEKLEA